ncbi:MAG: AarF/ABC1/UbiB kinase family protein [Pseudomonadota bacterium]
MTMEESGRQGLAVPSGRLARVASLGGAVGGIAADMAARGLGQAVRGQRPRLRDLMLTPGNVGRLTDELARMRGAAMKMGQLLSMDAGDLLPPELAEVMARLRSDAAPMPPKQLKAVLTAAWGEGWIRRFRSFGTTPIAAASIGQVHRAVTKGGDVLAIKVQYPGVRASIGSDVDNVGTLLRLSGLMPEGVDPAPFLAEAKRQLHDEADYAQEAAQLGRFGALMAGVEDFVVPRLEPSLSTRDVLAMSFEPGVAVETLVAEPQALRDRVAARLLGLCFREIFGFGLVQTDPNFANYRYDAARDAVVLLDFGAARAVPEPLVAALRGMMRAAMADDRPAMRQAAVAVGFIGAETAERHAAGVVEMIAMGAAPFRVSGVFDFGADLLPDRMREAGTALALDRSFDHVPPMDILYLQRKLAGMYLLAARLRARVSLRPLIEPWLEA